MAKMTQDEFVVNGVVKLRKEPFKGIHTVISGLNEGFRAYFGEGADPVAHVNDMEKRGIIEGHASKKGRTIYLKGEMPERFSSKQSEARAQATIDIITGKAAPKVLTRKQKEQVASKRMSKLTDEQLNAILSR